MPKYKDSNIEKARDVDYSELIEKIMIEFGDFLTVAKIGRTQRHSCFKARQKSKKLEESLKLFRMVANKHQKRIEKIIRDSKIQVDTL